MTAPAPPTGITISADFVPANEEQEKRFNRKLLQLRTLFARGWPEEAARRTMLSVQEHIGGVPQFVTFTIQRLGA